jgi:hypothetical protein
MVGPAGWRLHMPVGRRQAGENGEGKVTGPHLSLFVLGCDHDRAVVEQLWQSLLALDGPADEQGSTTTALPFAVRR